MSNWFEYHILSIVDGLGLFSFYSPLSRVVSFWEHVHYDPHMSLMFGNDVNSPCNSIYVIYVIYLCLPVVVSNTYCVVFLFCLSSSCVTYLASVSGLFIIDCPFGILYCLFDGVFNATFNNISVISWRSDLLVEDPEILRLTVLVK